MVGQSRHYDVKTVKTMFVNASIGTILKMSWLFQRKAFEVFRAKLLEMDKEHTEKIIQGVPIQTNKVGANSVITKLKSTSAEIPLSNFSGFRLDYFLNYSIRH